MSSPETFKLVLTLSDKIVIGLITAFTSATLAFFFNWMHWRRDKSLESFRVLSKELVSVLENLEGHVIEYWSRDYCEDKKSEDISLETKIKIKVTSIKKIIDLIFDVKKVERTDKDYIHFKQCIDRIYDISTGGEFESSRRKISKSVISKVTRYSADLRIGVLRFTYCEK